MIAGFPVGKIVGHHAPSAASPDDVENAIDNTPSGVLSGASPYPWRIFWQMPFKDFPFGISQTTWILWHPKFLAEREGFVQIKNWEYLFLRQPPRGVSPSGGIGSNLCGRCRARGAQFDGPFSVEDLWTARCDIEPTGGGTDE